MDIKAEEFAGLTPYQFGGNNPVMFNDPMGDKLTTKGPDGKDHVKWWSDFMWDHYDSFSSGGREGGDFTAFWSVYLEAAKNSIASKEKENTKRGISLYFDYDGKSLGSLSTGDRIIATEIGVFSPFIKLYLDVISKTTGLDQGAISTFDKLFRSFGTSYDISSFIKYDHDNRGPAVDFGKISVASLSDFKINGKPSKLYAEVYGSNHLVNGVVTAGKTNEYQMKNAITGYFADYKDKLRAGWVSDIHNHHVFSENGIWTAIYSGALGSANINGRIFAGPSDGLGKDTGRAQYVHGYRSVVVDQYNVYLYTENLNNTIYIKIP